MNVTQEGQLPTSYWKTLGNGDDVYLLNVKRKGCSNVSQKIQYEHNAYVRSYVLVLRILIGLVFGVAYLIGPFSAGPNAVLFS